VSQDTFTYNAYSNKLKFLIIKETQEFYDKVKMINQVDEVKKIQNQLSKIEQIRSLQRRRHERFSKVK